jgi:hypothetical protein
MIFEFESPEERTFVTQKTMTMTMTQKVMTRYHDNEY